MSNQAYGYPDNFLRKLLEAGIDPAQFGAQSDEMSGEYQGPEASQNALAEMMQQAGARSQDVLVAPRRYDMSGNETPTVNGDFKVYAGDGRRQSIDLNAPWKDARGGEWSLGLPTSNPNPPATAEKLGDRVEVVGKGMGRYSQDGRSVVFPNGSTHDLRPMRSKEELQEWFNQQKAMQGLQSGELNMAHQREQIASIRATREMRENPNAQSALEKMYGHPEKGMRLRPDGTQEPIPGGTKETDAKEVLNLLNIADPLIDKATGSYGGAGLDALGRLFGSSSEGGNAAAQLKALQGALISKMPKMTGPQSDKDVQLYREMAGQIGDATIPAEQKRAAMQTIRTLNQQYAGNQPAAAQPAQQRAGGVPMAAVKMLQADPSLRGSFDAKYGPGMAARVLGR